MLFLTGDTHGSFDRLSYKNWQYSKNLTRDDYVIVLGDFGLLFNQVISPEEVWWTNWLNERPWTMLFIDGNHENFDKLTTLPVVNKFGGSVGMVSDNIYHLRRGEVYEICGKKILTFGGATSIDKCYRREFISWWAQEVPNGAEVEHCLSNLEKHNFQVDYIMSHTCPNFLLPSISDSLPYAISVKDPTSTMLDHIFTVCKYSHAFCGHMHVDIDYGNYHILYHRILNISELTDGR